MIKVDIKRDNLEFKLDIKLGEFLAIVGQSGSGKTTLLRVIAGLEEARGVIEVDGKYWLMNNQSLKVQNRSIGFLMQDYALFNNMRVIENVTFVNSDLELAKRVLSFVDMWEYKDRYPHNLSGGQKQRVALARAIISKPKLLLLDEPLSALDLQMRIKLQNYILRLHKEFNLTTIMVSHDLGEVYKMADRVVTLNSGKISKVEDIKYDTNSLKAKLIDKSINKNSYELTLDINGIVSKILVQKSIFNKYKLGDLIDLNWSIK